MSQSNNFFNWLFSYHWKIIKDKHLKELEKVEIKILVLLVYFFVMQWYLSFSVLRMVEVPDICKGIIDWWQVKGQDFRNKI